MTDGTVMSNEEWADALRESDARPEVIEDWLQDRRGNNTIRVILTCEDLIRIIYLTVPSGRYASRDPGTAKFLAAGWVQNLQAAIEEGSTR